MTEKPKTIPEPKKQKHIPPRTARRLKTKENIAKALELRIAGNNFMQIGQALGLSTTRAFELVDMALNEAIARRDAAVPVVRELELQRLDGIL
jgi:hypothetical protein